MDPNTNLLMKSFYSALSHWRRYPLTLLENRLQIVEAIVFYTKKLGTSLLPSTLLLQSEVDGEINRLFTTSMHTDEDGSGSAPVDPTCHHQIFTTQEVALIGPYIFGLFHELSCSPELMRASAVQCLEKLFCTPRTALMLNLVAISDYGEECSQHEIKECSLRLLTTDALRVRDILVKGCCDKQVERDQLSPLLSMFQKIHNQCSKQAVKTSLPIAGELEMEFEDTIVWRRDHPSIGMMVSKKMKSNIADTYQQDQPSKKRTLSENMMDVCEGLTTKQHVVHGRVIGYLPLKTQVASRHNLNVYRVEFDDGSISELYDAQLRDAELLYNKAENWTLNHDLINANMAKYFPDTNHKRKQQAQSKPRMRLFCGRVTKFSPAVEDESVALFHVVYEDGDQEDMEYEELIKCLELNAQHFST